jgi:hypothetical protein
VHCVLYVCFSSSRNLTIMQIIGLGSKNHDTACVSLTMRIRIAAVVAALIALALYNISANSATYYSSLSVQQPCETPSCPDCSKTSTTTLANSDLKNEATGRDGDLVLQAASLKRNSILYVIDVRTTPAWQQERIRKRLDGRVFYILVASLDQSAGQQEQPAQEDTLLMTKQADEHILWSQVHKRIQSSISPTWIVQIHADTTVDFEAVALNLTSANAWKTERSQATVLGCPLCLAKSANHSASSGDHMVLLGGSSTLKFRQFHSWTPLIFNHAASSALATTKQNAENQVSTVDVTDFISDRNPDHCHYQNDVNYRIRTCHTWSMVQRMEPSPSSSSAIDMSKLPDVMIQKHHTTVVTAFIPLNAKHGADKYDRWMKTMLSIQEPVVAFVPLEYVDRIKGFRQHAGNRTLIIPMDISDLPLANVFPTSFWENQLEIDREKDIHKDYRVFLVWLSKTWWVQEAVRLNPFLSDIFMWIDIGSMRFNTDDRYEYEYLVRYPELVPRHSLLQMAHMPLAVHRDLWLPFKRKKFFFHSGAQAVAYHDTWIDYHRELQRTLIMFAKRGNFIGEDQILMQHTCIRTSLCVYARTEETDEDNYFGLKYILHFGGSHQYDLTPTLSNVEFSENATHGIFIETPTKPRRRGTNKN